MTGKAPKLTLDDLADLAQHALTLPPDEKRKKLDLIKQYKSNILRESGKNSFLDFITHVYPG